MPPLSAFNIGAIPLYFLNPAAQYGHVKLLLFNHSGQHEHVKKLIFYILKEKIH